MGSSVRRWTELFGVWRRPATQRSSLGRICVLRRRRRRLASSFFLFFRLLLLLFGCSQQRLSTNGRRKLVCARAHKPRRGRCCSAAATGGRRRSTQTAPRKVRASGGHLLTAPAAAAAAASKPNQSARVACRQSDARQRLRGAVSQQISSQVRVDRIFPLRSRSVCVALPADSKRMRTCRCCCRTQRQCLRRVVHTYLNERSVAHRFSSIVFASLAS